MREPNMEIGSAVVVLEVPMGAKEGSEIHRDGVVYQINKVNTGY